MRLGIIVGCGRSGTNWLAKILAESEACTVTREDKPLFNLVVDIVVRGQRDRIKTLIPAYRNRAMQYAPSLFVDKSHPALFLVDELAAAFPASEDGSECGIQFVGIERNPFATVASMLLHEGVSGWLEQTVPVPSPFFGIGEGESLEAWRAKPPHMRPLQRWWAHHVEMARIKAAYPQAVHVIEYEALVENHGVELAALDRFLQGPLGNPNWPALAPAKEIRTDSLDKWERTLTDQQKDDIEGGLVEYARLAPCLLGGND